MSATTNKISVAEIQHRLESGWAQWSQSPVDDPPVAAALERLAREVVDLRDAGHGWATGHLANFGNESTWRGYCLEVHFAAGFLGNGLCLQPTVRTLRENDSDVDFVYQSPDGSRCNFELLSIAEAEGVWNEVEMAPGVNLLEAKWDGDDGAQQIRRLQDRLRRKTVNKGQAWKFPVPKPDEYNVLVADVSGLWMGQAPDYWDYQVLAYGTEADVPEWCRREVLGLFQRHNPVGSQFQAEFDGNQFLRERVHLIVFLSDTAMLRVLRATCDAGTEVVWRVQEGACGYSSVNPRYYGAMVHNPGLLNTERQHLRLLEALGPGFADWVEAWDERPAVDEVLTRLRAMADEAGVSFDLQQTG